MKFLAGFLIGAIGGLFAVWYTAAHPTEQPMERWRYVPLRPNGYEPWAYAPPTTGSAPNSFTITERNN